MILLIIVSYTSFFVVNADEEAVITQREKVVRGNIGPGLQYKIPFFQKEHIIKKHLIRKCEYTSSIHENIKAIVMWNVSDSTSFFLFSRGKDNKEIKNILESKTEEAISLFDDMIINQIALAQEENLQYADKNSLMILKQLQSSIKQFGINLHLIVYKKM